MTKQIICSSCGELKPNYAKGLCKCCYNNNYQKIRYNTNEDFRQKKLKQLRQSLDTIKYSKEACEVLTQHADEHCNDDDRLTTDFIVDTIERSHNHKYSDKEKNIFKKLTEV